MNQSLIDEIVSGVLARLQPAPVRPVSPVTPSQIRSASQPQVSLQSPVAVAAASSVATPIAPSSPAANVPAVIELLGPIITADVLEQSVRAGHSLRIGRTSILTPSARDWLHTKKTPWTRQDRSAAASGGPKAKWQIILQTVTPTVRSLQDGLRKLADGWKIELVGHPFEAAKLATHLVCTAECDGVVVFTEQADLIACHANRNERVRAAVMQNSKQWEQVMQTLSANVVCISPIGRTFIELRNLLRDCAGTRPRAPGGMS